MNKLIETWKKLPTGGKIAIGAGVAALIVYVWKSGSGSNATVQPSLSTNTTDTYPIGDSSGGDSSGTDSGGFTWGGSSGGTDSGSVGGGGTSVGSGGTNSGASNPVTSAPAPAPVAPVTTPVVVPPTTAQSVVPVTTQPVTVLPNPSPAPVTPSTPPTPVGTLLTGNSIVVTPAATQAPAPADASHVVGNMTSATSKANSNVTTQVVGYQPTNKWSNINGTYFVADKTGKVVATYTGQDALYKAINQAKKIGGKSLEYALPGQ